MPCIRPTFVSSRWPTLFLRQDQRCIWGRPLWLLVVVCPHQPNPVSFPPCYPNQPPCRRLRPWTWRWVTCCPMANTNADYFFVPAMTPCEEYGHEFQYDGEIG